MTPKIIQMPTLKVLVSVIDAFFSSHRLKMIFSTVSDMENIDKMTMTPKCYRKFESVTQSHEPVYSMLDLMHL